VDLPEPAKKSSQFPFFLTPPPPPPCFPRVFWALRSKGSSKTPQKYSYKKSMSEAFRKKIDKSFDVSPPRLLVCFIAFSGVSQQWEFKNTTKNVLQKSRVEEF
jgi:hypothetical protein